MGKGKIKENRERERERERGREMVVFDEFLCNEMYKEANCFTTISALKL